MSTPRVSIVIPAYNQAGFLKEALESLLKQTVTDWEAIVVNNFSDDATVEVVESFEDPRIQLVNFKNQGVIAASRNQGARLAKAEVLAFLDSDDLWYPEKLEKCLEALKGDVGVVNHDFEIIGDYRAQTYLRTGPYTPDFLRSLLYRSNCVVTSGVLMRKQIFDEAGGFCEDREIITSEDFDLWLTLAEKKVVFHFINEPLGAYRVHAYSNSNSISFHHEAILRVVKKHLPGLEKPSPWRTRALFSKLFYSTARAYHYQKNAKGARACFLEAIRYNPLSLRPYAGLALSLLHC